MEDKIIMKIYVIEKEGCIDDRFWQEEGIIPCISLEVATREMDNLIVDSDEGEFVYSEDRLSATSKNGWVRFTILPLEVKE